jgi:hypothetical protein
VHDSNDILGQYWVCRNGKWVGPFSEEQLQQLVDANIVSKTDKIRHADTEGLLDTTTTTPDFPTSSLRGMETLPEHGHNGDHRESSSHAKHAKKVFREPEPLAIGEIVRPSRPPQPSRIPTSRKASKKDLAEFPRRHLRHRLCPKCGYPFLAEKFKYSPSQFGLPFYDIRFLTGTEHGKCPRCRKKSTYSMSPVRFWLSLVLLYLVGGEVAFDVVQGRPLGSTPQETAVRMVILLLLGYMVIRGIFMSAWQSDVPSREAVEHYRTNLASGQGTSANEQTGSSSIGAQPAYRSRGPRPFAAIALGVLNLLLGSAMLILLGWNTATADWTQLVDCPVWLQILLVAILAASVWFQGSLVLGGLGLLLGSGLLAARTYVGLGGIISLVLLRTYILLFGMEWASADWEQVLVLLGTLTLTCLYTLFFLVGMKSKSMKAYLR